MSTNLDFLRAFAVLCVLSSHVVSIFYTSRSLRIGGLGRLGVLLFFVHTSFVLIQSLDRHGKQRGWIRRFYLRRAFRIYPLATVCMLVVLLFHVPGVPHGIYSPGSWKSVTANLLLMQNLISSDHRFSVIGPAWSLPYEIQMYVLLPCIFTIFTAVAIRQRWICLIGVVTLALGLARLNYVWPKQLPELMSFFPCFIGGVIAWQLSQTLRPWLQSFMWPLVLLVLSVIYIFWAAPKDDMRLQWLLCLLLGSVVPLFRQIRTPWLTSASRQIATYSYGIYLVQDPMLWLAFVRLNANIYWQFTCFLMLVMIVPLILYKWVEEPMIRAGAVLTSSNSVGKSRVVPGISAPIEVQR